MQTVDAVFTAESKEDARKIASSVQVSWKKGLDPNIVLFTIGVSTIGGDDVIAGEAGVTSAWNKYQYFDESDYVMDIDYERGLNLPEGGVAKGLFDVRLDNTDRRFTPRFMGGTSELFTSILPRRPIVINAGFNYDGIDHMLPQFVGINTKNPKVNQRQRHVTLRGADFIDFLQNRYVDRTTMFTGLRSDEVMEDILTELGYTTAQYELDTGKNLIPFGIYRKGAKLANIFNELARAEYGHVYQDVEGKIRFESRTHWGASPHTEVQKVITTAEVLNARTIGQDHIINVVEVISKPRVKKPAQQVFDLILPIQLDSGDNSIFIDYDNPVLEVTAQTFTANTQDDGTGTDKTSSVSVKSREDFAESSKFIFHNSDSNPVFLTQFTVNGRPAKVQEEIYVREEYGSSITAYEEQPLRIKNDYIQSEEWAETYATMILEDFASPENLQQIRIMAKPELELGDLISWQGRYWRIYNIETQIDKDAGFIQDLKLVQRDIVSYFQIGISTIGGDDKIAP